ncbi:MAG: trypsin-like peptidase domain-containing protein [Candidatus Eremiobacteraeota bacterium]|nr:trypsin-like peptidase domain-containing protein [Candidatus Eremiobacteraeota bacterium]MBC5803937.1 trypsin-like peptidase domain-containing protein [Candidatus Eremiobacteraeota bacterium]MBC5822345.1 trypsin-like peptidase domain-containing protein [Candidatus Eremiobacteraeota bacterium]
MSTAARVLISTLGFAFALLAPSMAAAAQRGGDGGVVVLADNGAMHGIGAGTIVGVDGAVVRVVTAKHVATFGTLRIRLDDGMEFPARPFAVSSNHDLAVLEAQVDPAVAATLHAAPLAQPRSDEPVHAWGSGNDGPAFEPAAIDRVDAPLPDGAANGRYALSCALCHRGDSGAGVFNSRGELIGVYIGYFDVARGRVSVAERPLDIVTLAMVGSTPKIARSNKSATPSIVASSGTVAPTTAPRNAPSISASSATASASGLGADTVPAAASARK